MLQNIFLLFISFLFFLFTQSLCVHDGDLPFLSAMTLFFWRTFGKISILNLHLNIRIYIVSEVDRELSAQTIKILLFPWFQIIAGHQVWCAYWDYSQTPDIRNLLFKNSLWMRQKLVTFFSDHHVYQTRLWTKEICGMQCITSVAMQMYIQYCVYNIFTLYKEYLIVSLSML